MSPRDDFISRREFAGAIARGAVAAACAGVLGSRPYRELLGDEKTPPDSEGSSKTSKPRLAVASGKDARTMVKSALNSLGGMSAFVKKGQKVFLKPNMSFDRAPEQAANTSPEVVAALVELCLAAGAKEVVVADRTLNDARRSYRRSGIEAAATEAGAKVVLLEEDESLYQEVDIPQGRVLKKWRLLKMALEAEVLINVPVAKHHSLTKLSLGLKNLMGLMGGERGSIHGKIHQALPDLATRLKPALTVVDATRVLVANGPSGGRLSDVKSVGKVIAGADPVLADAYAASLPEFACKPEDVGYIKTAAEMGLGTMNVKDAELVETTV